MGSHWSASARLFWWEFTAYIFVKNWRKVSQTSPNNLPKKVLHHHYLDELVCWEQTLELLISSVCLWYFIITEPCYISSTRTTCTKSQLPHSHLWRRTRNQKMLLRTGCWMLTDRSPRRWNMKTLRGLYQTCLEDTWRYAGHIHFMGNSTYIQMAFLSTKKYRAQVFKT